MNHTTPTDLAARIAMLEGHVAALRGALFQAMSWHGVDHEGVPAVWLDEAGRAIAATGPGLGQDGADGSGRWGGSGVDVGRL